MNYLLTDIVSGGRYNLGDRGTASLNSNVNSVRNIEKRSEKNGNNEIQEKFQKIVSEIAPKFKSVGGIPLTHKDSKGLEYYNIENTAFNLTKEEANKILEAFSQILDGKRATIKLGKGMPSDGRANDYYVTFSIQEYNPKMPILRK